MSEFIKECLNSIDEAEQEASGLDALDRMSRGDSDYEFGDLKGASSALVDLVHEIERRVNQALEMAGPYAAPSLLDDFKIALQQSMSQVRGPATPTLSDISGHDDTDRGGAGNATDSGTSPGNTHSAVQVGDGLVM